jgi:restriction system protein
MSTSPQLITLDDVPSYQKLMLPLLQFAADGGVHSISEAFEPIAKAISLSENARKSTLPDGRNKLRHRLEWARTYLKKAGLLIYPRRGAFSITSRGQQILKRNISEITREVLLEFPEFNEFVGTSRAEPQTPLPVSSDEIDPEEAFENAHLALRKALEDELLERVKSATPEFLEQLVIDLLLKMGYGGSRKDAGKALGKTGDGGIDGIINEDPLGLDVVYVQAKRWTENSVGRPEIQRFVGALQEQRAKKGVFITTSTFSRDARDYVARIDARVVLIDGAKLAGLMADSNVGVTDGKGYTIKRIDADYFSEE